MPKHYLSRTATAKMPPTPRADVYDLFWVFAARRQQAFMRRLNGQPWPWSTDPIIQRFKFCNVFRAADRVTQYLIREIAYGTDDVAPHDLIFQIVAFRMFSSIETWQSLRQRLGRQPLIEDLHNNTFVRTLDDIKLTNGGLFTGAFILCANKAFGYDEKHRNYAALLNHMFCQSCAAEKILGAPSLRDIVELLRSYPLIGDFMSYQIAIDLNYSSIVNFDENDFTVAGPGCVRGINKAFTDLGDYSEEDIVQLMVSRQHVEFPRLGLEFGGLFGRPLHAIDCQNLFCELDKYCREAMPSLKSNRSRIKARFQPSSTGLELFFPPKWGIRPLISRTLRADRSAGEPGVHCET